MHGFYMERQYLSAILLEARPCSTSWARFFHMVSKAGISRFLSISSSNSWAMTLVPDFNACFLSNLLGLSRFQVSDSLRDGTVSQAPWQKCCHLGLKTTRDMIHHFVARELWHSGRNGIQQEQQPVVHVMLHILGQGGCKAL